MRKGGPAPAIKKPLKMMKAARAELLAFPGDTRCEAGYALRVAELGGMHPAAKPLKGFSGASILEIVLEDVSGAYRVIYTVQFKNCTVLLHAFQKKSVKGIETPRRHIKIIEERLKAAKALFGEGL